MADTTTISSDISTAVENLRKLIKPETVKAFEELNKFELHAGDAKIDAARWLEDLLVDRRHGLIEHVKNLQFIFDGLADTLKNTANVISETDSSSANGLGSSGNGQGNNGIAEVNQWISSVINNKVPPARGQGHYLTNKDSYDTKDAVSNDAEAAWLDESYKIGPDGLALRDKDGNIVIDNPSDRPLPVPNLLKDYQNIITDVNGRPGKDPNADIVENYIFSDSTILLGDDDPVD